jgi:hypothetical protein
MPKVVQWISICTGQNRFHLAPPPVVPVHAVPLPKLLSLLNIRDEAIENTKHVGSAQPLEVRIIPMNDGAQVPARSLSLGITIRVSTANRSSSNASIAWKTPRLVRSACQTQQVIHHNIYQGWWKLILFIHNFKRLCRLIHNLRSDTDAYDIIKYAPKRLAHCCKVNLGCMTDLSPPLSSLEGERKCHDADGEYVHAFCSCSHHRRSS